VVFFVGFVVVVVVFLFFFFKRGLVDSLVEEPIIFVLILSTDKLCAHVEAGGDKKAFALKTNPTKMQQMKVLHHEADPEKPTCMYCQSYPICNKTSNLICNAYPKKKKVKPLSASWSPVNWNLSFPLLFTCNQTGEISVNLFPNILAMS